MSQPERYFDCRNSHEFAFTTVDDAVEDYLRDVEPRDWPATLLVKCYERQKVSAMFIAEHALSVLASLREDLDSEYGGGDTGHSSVNTGLPAACRFVEQVVADYVVWRCDETPAKHVTVRVAEWIAEQEPLWVYDPEIAAAIERMEAP